MEKKVKDDNAIVQMVQYSSPISHCCNRIAVLKQNGSASIYACVFSHAAAAVAAVAATNAAVAASSTPSSATNEYKRSVMVPSTPTTPATSKTLKMIKDVDSIPALQHLDGKIAGEEEKQTRLNEVRTTIFSDEEKEDVKGEHYNVKNEGTNDISSLMPPPPPAPLQQPSTPRQSLPPPPPSSSSSSGGLMMRIDPIVTTYENETTQFTHATWITESLLALLTNPHS
eukprot:8418832-Ditylum_brightwellii.AAC.1